MCSFAADNERVVDRIDLETDIPHILLADLVLEGANDHDRVLGSKTVDYRLVLDIRDPEIDALKDRLGDKHVAIELDAVYVAVMHLSIHQSLLPCSRRK